MRVLIALVLTGCLALPALAETAAVRSITVTGQATRKVVPDEAHMTVNLNSIDKTMAQAKQAHDRKLQKLMDLTAKAGIDAKKVRTQSSNVEPVYTYNNNTRNFEGYRVQTNLDITVKDTSKLGNLMDAITSAGFENGAKTEWGNLLNVYYTLSDPNKLRDELLSEAITNAHDKAVRMAQAAGEQIGAVYQINENGTPQFNPRPPMPMMAMAMKASRESVTPPAGEQDVESSVTVTYELK